MVSLPLLVGALPQRESSYRKRESFCATGDAFTQTERGQANGHDPGRERQNDGREAAAAARSVITTLLL